MEFQPTRLQPRLRHGVRMMQDHPVKDWPAPLKQAYEDIVQELEGQKHLDKLKHRLAIHQCARLHVILGQVYDHLSKAGLHRPNGEPDPILRFLVAMENCYGRCLERLALTPASFRKVHLMISDTRPPWAKALSGETDDGDD